MPIFGSAQFQRSRLSLPQRFELLQFEHQQSCSYTHSVFKNPTLSRRELPNIVRKGARDSAALQEFAIIGAIEQRRVDSAREQNLKTSGHVLPHQSTLETKVSPRILRVLERVQTVYWL